MRNCALPPGEARVERQDHSDPNWSAVPISAGKPISLPAPRACCATAPQSPTQDAGAACVQVFSILVVDDDPSMRFLTQSLLEREGYQVEVALDGEAGWECLRRDRFDLLITDHDMPRLTGLELCQRIRADGLQLPIIVASGAVEFGKADERARLDLTAVVSKPFDWEEFLLLIRQAVTRGRTG